MTSIPSSGFAPRGFPRRGWENDRRHHPEKARMDAQGRKDPRSLRNCYLTEDPEEIALAVTQPVRKLGIVVQGGRSRPWQRLQNPETNIHKNIHAPSGREEAQQRKPLLGFHLRQS